MKKNTRALVCFSHLRWNFVHQRPQHLLTRAARERDVFFIEEALHEGEQVALETYVDPSGVHVVVPHLPGVIPADSARSILRAMLAHFLKAEGLDDAVLWYYTPMALDWAPPLRGAAVVYDCMDELALFRGAPPELGAREEELLARADVVFTGGHALYEHKRSRHPNMHPFPSSVDVPHFAQARASMAPAADQVSIPGPRAGYFGVIDERMDIELLARVADLRPEVHFVMVGPVVKIDPRDLPQRPNIHWLGGKSYAELPRYLAGWDVALLPFARNDSTRFISPTKTPEYLAAGRPVVSTSIRDVVRPYAELGLARIADTPQAFAAAIDAALAEDAGDRLERADAFLRDLSWDRTWTEMWSHVEKAIDRQPAPASVRTAALAAATLLTEV
jgi:glycosyltransferase involved in cell wall biosynthesis